ncbi:MAG TPA: riboflavin synthase [Polyangiaceae bacterium]|nr:riboflavin synthase [Polyangiaceae bacterium]
MFTGIVETTGILAARAARGPSARLVITTHLGPLALGESIAVHGVCLTVHTITASGFECDATAETLARTTLGSIPEGSRVHLERSLSVGARLGGHIVAGHVDCKIRLRSREAFGDAAKLTFEIEDPGLSRYVARKGSVSIDGVSLTVNGVSGHIFDVMIIPHTLEVTTLGDLRAGGEANLEVDLLARYVARLLDAGQSLSQEGPA